MNKMRDMKHLGAVQVILAKFKFLIGELIRTNDWKSFPEESSIFAVHLIAYNRMTKEKGGSNDVETGKEDKSAKESQEKPSNVCKSFSLA